MTLVLAYLSRARNRMRIMHRACVDLRGVYIIYSRSLFYVRGVAKRETFSHSSAAKVPFCDREGSGFRQLLQLPLNWKYTDYTSTRALYAERTGRWRAIDA